MQHTASKLFWTITLGAGLAVACSTPSPRGLPPQSPAKFSGPEFDTSELQQEEEAPTETTMLHILHTNDMHGQVYPRKGKGGINAVAGYIQKVRGEVGEDKVLLVDSGDFFAGTPEGNLTEGKIMIDIMNTLGYDAMAVGNHEFDLGIQVMVDLASQAKFPFLLANAYANDGDLGPKAADAIKPVTIIERAGTKIGIVGLLAQDTPQMTHKQTGEALTFFGPATAAQDAIGTLKAEGAQLINVLSHVGKENEMKMADSLPSDITGIFGGHSHTAIDPMYRSESTGIVYVQTGAKASGINHVTLEIGAEGAKVVDGKLIPLKADDWQDHPPVAEIINRYKPEIEKVMSESLGTCAKELTRTRGDIKSSTLGNWMTNIMKLRTKADIAIQNKTGIRANLPAGELKMRNLYEVAPFGNELVKMSLTGQQISDLFEYAGREDRHNLETNGIKVVYNLKKEAGKRVVSLKVGNKPINLKKTYTVVTNSFLADGGDGHQTFTQGTKRNKTGIVLRDALAQYMRDNSKGCTLNKTPFISTQ